MRDDTNKKAVINAIWGNPEPAFGAKFRDSGKYKVVLPDGEKYKEKGKIRIALTEDKGGITVFYNGSSKQEYRAVIKYLADELGTHDDTETMQEIARLYNIKLEFSPEEQLALRRSVISREVCAVLVDALKNDPDGPTMQYLIDKRKLRPDGVHFGELTEQSIQAVAKHLQERNVEYSADDLRALGIERSKAEKGYNLVIPFLHNGHCIGFTFRNINDNLPSDKPKYLNSVGMTRGAGFCDRITPNEPAVIVEGQIDAIRLIQAGIRNVIAMAGASITNELAASLHDNGITQLTYIPDTEFTPAKVKLTKTTTNAMGSFLKAKADGERVVGSLYVAEVPAPNDIFSEKYGVVKGVGYAKYKIDVDTYGKNNGNEALKSLVKSSIAWWNVELNNLLDWAEREDKEHGIVNINEFQNRFDVIYNLCAKVNPYDKQRVRDYIKQIPAFGMFGVTPGALDDVDGWNRDRTMTDRIKATASDLQKVVNDGANPVKVAEVLARLSDIQAADTREEWAKQLGQTFEDELEEIRNQPDTLKTKWQLGKVSDKGKFNKYNDIEFYPADITVFCAATSHGKTAILFQSALDLVAADREKEERRTYLYVSCEENKRQLLERALNVYIDIPTTETGKDADGKYCFISQTRKKSIKAAIRGGYVPAEYNPYMGHSAHFDDLQKLITAKIEQYGREVRPFLKLIHTDGTTESIVTNITHYVNKLQDEGQTVGAVFIDYAQLLTTEVKNFSRQDELKGVFKALEMCAKKTELPFIMAAQLNRDSIKNGIDSITLANLGEAADIERAAHDVYLVWQVDKTKEDTYKKVGPSGNNQNHKKDNNEDIRSKYKWDAFGERSLRIFVKPNANSLEPRLKTIDNRKGYLYIETMKARDGRTGGWGMLPFDGERGHIDENSITNGMGSIPQVKDNDKK